MLRTVDTELAGRPDHISRVTENHIGSMAVDQEKVGWVLHLQGQVDASAVNWLELQRRLEELTVLAIDGRSLSCLGSRRTRSCCGGRGAPPSRAWGGRPGC